MNVFSCLFLNVDNHTVYKLRNHYVYLKITLRPVQLQLFKIFKLSLPIARAGGGPYSRTPGYLSVPDHKECLGNIQQGTASFYCLPKEKPKSCPQSSWEAPQNYKDCHGRPFIPCKS